MQMMLRLSWLLCFVAACAGSGKDLSNGSTGTNGGDFDEDAATSSDDLACTAEDCSPDTCFDRGQCGESTVFWLQSSTSRFASDVEIGNGTTLTLIGDANPSSTSVARDGYVTQLDAQAQTTWTTSLSTSENDFLLAAALDKDGMTYVVGRSLGDLSDQQNKGASDVLVAKLDTDGTVVWQRLFGTTNADWGNDIAIGPDWIAVAATWDRDDEAATASAVVLLLDSSGTEVARFVHKGSGDLTEGNAIAVDSRGQILLAGISQQESSPLSSNLYVTSLSFDGEENWSTQWGSDSADTLGAINLHPDGTIVVVGKSLGSIDGTSNGGKGDAFVTLLEPEGDIRWTSTLATPDDTSWNDVTIASNGTILVAGQSESADDGSARWARFDTKGRLITLSDGPDGLDLVGRSIVEASDGSIWLAGDGRQDEGDAIQAFLFRIRPRN